jgi:hypothetical protein
MIALVENNLTTDSNLTRVVHSAVRPREKTTLNYNDESGGEEEADGLWGTGPVAAPVGKARCGARKSKKAKTTKSVRFACTLLADYLERSAVISTLDLEILSSAEATEEGSGERPAVTHSGQSIVLLATAVNVEHAAASMFQEAHYPAHIIMKQENKSKPKELSVDTSSSAGLAMAAAADDFGVESSDALKSFGRTARHHWQRTQPERATERAAKQLRQEARRCGVSSVHAKRPAAAVRKAVLEAGGLVPAFARGGGEAKRCWPVADTRRKTGKGNDRKTFQPRGWSKGQSNLLQAMGQ